MQHFVVSGFFARNFKSRGSSVGTGWTTKEWELSPDRVKNFHFSISSRMALRSSQLPIQWVRGASSQGIKWQGRETDHSPPTSAEVKKT
jgi:hypothetical protein